MRIFLQYLAPVLFWPLLPFSAQAQKTAPPLLEQLLGKWAVVAYTEQGVPVDKLAPAGPQAVRVYEHIRDQRASTFYNYQLAYEPLNRRENRDFLEWQQRDSILEVNRLVEAIQMPYYAVFFADSTLALYNRPADNSPVYFPESRRFALDAATMSIDIYAPGGFYRSDVQILFLDDQRMTLFIPEEAEVVELVKRPFKLP